MRDTNRDMLLIVWIVHTRVVHMQLRKAVSLLWTGPMELFPRYSAELATFHILRDTRQLAS